jgi:hypothetical protein
MADFSYATDIAPLRSQFFPVGGMSRLERQQIDTRYAKEIDPIDAKRREMQVNMIKLQEQEVSYEMQKMQLEEARRTARIKLETETRLPALMGELDSVLNNNQLDTNTKATEIGKLNMRYAAVAPYDQRVSTLLQAANNQVNTLNNIDENALRKANLAEQRQTSLLSTAVQMGETKVAENIAKSDGIISPSEQPFIDLAKGAEQTIKVKNIRDQQKQIIEREDKIRQGQYDLFKTFETRLNSIGRLKDTSDDEETPLSIAGSSKPNETIQNIVTTKDLTLNRANRIQLESMMLQLNPKLKPEQLKGVSDQNLFRAASQKTLQGLRANTPAIPTVSPILEGFGT